MSGESPTNNNKQANALGMAALEGMPSFTEHTQNHNQPKSFSELNKSEIPAGVRDEQDYKEYLDEQAARERERAQKLATPFYKLQKSEIPAGVRDEQDYKEYLEEQAAREREKAFVQANNDAQATPEQDIIIKEEVAVEPQPEAPIKIIEQSVEDQKNIAEQKAILQEKAERVGTFENRLNANKDLYNELAEYRAFLVKLYPDVGVIADNDVAHKDMNNRYGKHRHYATFDEHEPEEHAALAYRNAKFLMQYLSGNVEDTDHTIEDTFDPATFTEPYDSKKVEQIFDDYANEHPDQNLSPYVTIGANGVLTKESAQYNKEIYQKAAKTVIAKDQQKYFDEFLTGFIFSKSALEYQQKYLFHVPEETIAKAHEDAKEMLNGEKYEKPLDEIIKKRSNFDGSDFQKFDSLYIPNSDNTFTMTGYSYNSTPTFIPDLESIYRILEKRMRAEELLMEDRVHKFEYRTGQERGKKMYNLLIASKEK